MLDPLIVEAQLAARDKEISRLRGEHGDMNVHCVKLEKENERLTTELAFYEPKCSKCKNHLGLLAESACPYCRLTAEGKRKDEWIDELESRLRKDNELILNHQDSASDSHK